MGTSTSAGHLNGIVSDPGLRLCTSPSNLWMLVTNFLLAVSLEFEKKYRGFEMKQESAGFSNVGIILIIR